MIDSDNISAEYIIYIVSKIYSEKENVYFDLNSSFDWSINTLIKEVDVMLEWILFK